MLACFIEITGFNIRLTQILVRAAMIGIDAERNLVMIECTIEIAGFAESESQVAMQVGVF